MVYASVIIFDFNRPTFIKDAIASIKKNSNETDVEIILIKSYKDIKIEKFLVENNVHYIDLMEKTSQSDYIKASVNAASGEIMIFMDDDDLFYPEKIRHIISIFQANQNLGYYHNNFDTIDEFENIISNKNYKTPKFKSLYISNVKKLLFFKDRKNLRLLLKIRPDFNSSSIAIRKSLLSEFSMEYTFNVRPDSFIFTAALISSKDIMFENKVLTHYRIYGGNVSTSYNVSVQKLMETFTKAFSDGISMFDLIKRIINCDVYQNYVELRIINLKLAYNFWSLTRTYKISLYDKYLILRIDFIHESGYIILSLMPAFIKLRVMKKFYHAKK